MHIYKQKKIDPDAKKDFKMLPALSPPTARTSSSENSWESFGFLFFFLFATLACLSAILESRTCADLTFM